MTSALSQKLERTRRAWAVEKADGPASRWPRLTPRAGLEAFCRDRQGMGIPAESLPPALSPYSVCGWRLMLIDGVAQLRQGLRPAKETADLPTNEEGCKRLLELCRTDATLALSAWIELQTVLAEIAKGD